MGQGMGGWRGRGSGTGNKRVECKIKTPFVI